MSVILKELREQLEILPIGELRQKASKHFGMRLSRDDTKEDIINRIVGAASKQNFAREVASADVLPEPGWTRIRVHPVPQRSTFPFFAAINGVSIFIPFSVDVDVPTKFIAMLRNAQEMGISTDDFGNKTEQLQDSYPFSLIHTTPGPDPRPGGEKQRERKIAAKKLFEEEHGYWPKDSEVKELRQEIARAKLLKSIMQTEDGA